MAERCGELRSTFNDTAAVNIAKVESQPPMSNPQVRNGDNTHNLSPIPIPLPHITKLLLQSEPIGTIQQSELQQQQKAQYSAQQWSDIITNLPPLHELVSPSWLSDTERMRALRESVAALRMWVLSQPVVLGHPVGPSNPTFLQVCRGSTDSSTFPSAFLDQTFINLSWGLDPPPMFIHKAKQHLHSDDEEEELDLTDLSKYKMEQLRKYCRRNEVNVKSTRKQDLIDAILAHTLHKPALDSEKTDDSTGKAHLLETDDTASWRVQAASPTGVADAPGSTGDVPKRRYIRRAPISVTPHVSKSDQNRIQLLAAVSAAVSPVKKRKKRSEQSYAHLRNRDNDSCHRCKNKKKFSVGCPYSKSHRYCKSCIERHCGLDWEDMCKNSKTVWKDGCPVCRNVCDCAACMKRLKATRADITSSESQLSVLSTLATLDQPETRKRRKTATWQFGQDANVVDNKSDSEPLHDSQDDADDEAGDDDYEGTHPHVVKKARVVADYSEEPLAEDAMDQETLLTPTKPRGRGRGRGRGKGPRHSPKTEPVSTIRTRASSALLGDDITEEEEGEERDLLESRGLRKKNGVYEPVNDSTADAEAFLGLISGRAGSVLTRRYATNPSFDRFIATESAEPED